jgi:DNA mismatch repair protein MutL
MPDVIKLLPDSVANQIAAGEVIQRPASVVKELMENAVDAGASSIIVIIKDAGKTLVQVIDDGSGMSETDARLSFERHATSKISSATDLFAISTKGFRGEALASIAAVAMVELRTGTGGNDPATRIVISGSRVEIQEPCNCMKGSNFSVKNLFFNIPARRKFLKSDNTEMRHIINEFQKVVLAHPSIRFSLDHNDNDLYILPAVNIRQRVINLFGKQVNQDLITLDTETCLVNIRGFIGKPKSAYRKYGEQFFFVNNRYMRHPYFHKAVTEAYRNILPEESVPVYFIFLETDPSAIDINIHPTKTEIKFEDERSIWQILMASVREALGRFNIVPSLDFENEGFVDIPVRSATDSLPDEPPIKVNPDYNPFEGEDNGHGSNRVSGRLRRDSQSGWEKLFPTPVDEHELPAFEGDMKDTGRKFLQVKNKYIACPVKSGIMMIDQKRAHEKVLYEKYLGCLKNNAAVSQSSLFPLTVDFNPADREVISEIENDLKLLGFTITDTGATSVMISGHPPEASGDAAGMLRFVIDEYKITRADPLRGRAEKLASAMASAAAIPHGRMLSHPEMEALFDTLFACQSPGYAPNGKPVLTIIPVEELDRKFR